MKAIFPLLLVTLIYISVSAQAPQLLNYQAIARNNAGTVLPNQPIAVRLIIRDQTAAGTVLFSETHVDTTNQFGLFTLQIGNGSNQSANFSSVNWSTGNKFLEVDIDPAGGTNYADMGTSQLLSVPYALYAVTSGNGAGPTGANGATGANGTNGATGATGANGANGVTGVTGPSGVDGAVGASGPTGPSGINGAAGVSGPQGATGATGVSGIDGAAGVTGVTGATGPQGATGTQGTTGNNGTTGAQGATGNNGATGPTGAAGSAAEFADFYALMPADNAITIGAGSPVQFPESGISSSTITRINLSSFNIATPGNYQVYFQVSVSEAGQLALQLNGSLLSNTVVGRATGTSQITGTFLITTSVPNSVVEVINPPAEPAALTITPLAGGTNAVSAHLIITQLATDGAQGATGATGTQGATGANGATGGVGPSGTAGATGPSGAAGTAGTNGATGPAGATGAGAVHNSVFANTLGTASMPTVSYINIKTATITKASGATTNLVVYASYFGSTNTGNFYIGRIGYQSGNSYAAGSATVVQYGGGGGNPSTTGIVPVTNYAGYSIVASITGLAAGTYTVGLDNANGTSTPISYSLLVIEY